MADIRILVDDRERASGIPEALRSMGILVESRMLNVGDYIFSPECALERKSAADFVKSLYTGRLFDQAHRLSEAYENPVILVEGRLKDLLETMRNPRAFWGALVTLCLTHKIHVFFTEDVSQSIELIYILARQSRLSASRGPIARGKPRLSTVRERQLYVVSSLPGVGIKLADRMLSWSGSVRRVFSSSISELSLISGIGRIRAEAITDLLDAPYRKSEKSSPQVKLDAGQTANIIAQDDEDYRDFTS
jgi:DNA excision repair protein ERCC-4